MRKRLLVIALLVTLTAACATSGCQSRSPTTSPSAQLTLADVYERMSAAMSRAGEVFVLNAESTAVEGLLTYSKRIETWIDVSRGVGRSEVTATFGLGNDKSHQATWIVDGPRWYQAQEGVASKRPALICHESVSPLLALLLGCRGFGERSTTVIQEAGAQDASRSIGIVTTGTMAGRPGSESFSQTLHVDPTTYLPIALESAGVLEGAASPQRTGEIVRYTNGFVPLDTLPGDFFSPSTLGYSEPDPESTLDGVPAAMTYLWIGKDVAATGELPGLTLATAFVAGEQIALLLPYRAVLEYRDAADDFGAALVELEERPSDEPERTRVPDAEDWRDDRCSKQEDLTLDSGPLAGGHVRIVEGREASDDGGCAPAGNQSEARIEVGATVVLVTAPPGSAYASAAGMRRVVDALVVRR